MAGGALFFLLDLLPFWVEYFSSVQVLVDNLDACLSTSLIVMCLHGCCGPIQAMEVRELLNTLKTTFSRI